MTTKRQLIQKQQIKLLKTATIMNDLKKKDLPLLQQAIINCIQLKGANFQFAMLTNNQMLEAEIKNINEARIKPSEVLTTYLKERDEIKQAHTRKDENNEPVIITEENGQQRYDVIDIKALEAELKDFDEANKGCIDEQNEIDQDFDLLLNKDAECKLIRVDKADLPKDITGVQMSGIFRLINK